MAYDQLRVPVYNGRDEVVNRGERRAIPAEDRRGRERERESEREEERGEERAPCLTTHATHTTNSCRNICLCLSLCLSVSVSASLSLRLPLIISSLLLHTYCRGSIHYLYKPLSIYVLPRKHLPLQSVERILGPSHALLRYNQADTTLPHHVR